MFIEAWEYLAGHQAQFLAALWRHVALSASALAIAAAIAVPLGVRLADKGGSALVAINAANIGRTLPSLAVLALVMPILGTGFSPSWFALTLLAIPPVLINTAIGIRDVDADVIDAARGMGMNAREIVQKIRLPLTLPEGEVCVLIGPSGCGKTTTMRLINRMIEPSSGRIELGGRDVTHMDAVELRRGIGYVIQQVGLFPHQSIAENIAAVPRLIG